METPYGFDCYAFSPNEVKYFDFNVKTAKSIGTLQHNSSFSYFAAQESFVEPKSGEQMRGFIRFTRKNEDYTRDQLKTLARDGRFNENESSKQIFCGIKIQIGISVVTNFLNKGLQYKKPNKGRSELINGTWNGIVSGLTVDQNAANSYDIAFGNFLAYDEEFPYIKFGPFFAIESKLVMLTGSSRSIEASSFGTNLQSEIWFFILFLMLVLSILASLRVHWQHTKHHTVERIINHLLETRYNNRRNCKDETIEKNVGEQSLIHMLHNFFFIYFTMLLNKPSLEFDEFIWPKHDEQKANHSKALSLLEQQEDSIKSAQVCKLLKEKPNLKKHYDEMIQSKRKRKPLPTSIRIVSYLWSAACLVMASIYSGEMLAVILLHADQNIDTIQQLINSKPAIEPVIRQDDFTYNLMLKSLDQNMIILHNRTKIIPRTEVYTRKFIESVSERKQALLGDDELIETIYDIYHKYFPLYKSKITYLQYPISIMYRLDLNVKLEQKLRRGMVQMFEMGLINRWYQAQKETYINFYDSEKKDKANFVANSNSKYKPLSMQHFKSFFRLMLYCILMAFLVLFLELITYYISKRENNIK